MYKVVIIEDEKIAADNLSRMIHEANAFCEVVARIESVKEAKKRLAEIEFDLIFMDIHLTDGDAFEIFDTIELTKPIIFTTAFDQYVLQAFKFLSIDYLLKPIGKKELADSIHKFETHFLPNPENSIDLTALQHLLKEDSSYKERFLVQVGRKLKPYSVDQVLYFHSANKITFLTVEEGKSYPIDASLSQLEKELNPDQFFRINRQYIIARTAIHYINMVSPTKLKVILSADPRLDLYTSIDKMGKFKNWMR
ncbi:MAG: LytTR family DNA-binding domain-containing protein [Bacteroidota bacterium]